MAKPKQSKYSRARVRSKVRRPKQGASRGWLFATVGVTVVLAALVVLTVQERNDQAAGSPTLSDHWHSYLGVNICGTWAPPVPTFEGRDGSMTPNPLAGIHSHGDYLIHEHPRSSDETGKQATLGKYLGYAQSEVTATSIRLWPNWAPGVDYSNGDTCPGSDKPGQLYWKVAHHGDPWPEQARSGNPANYHMKNGDIIALYFVEKGSALEKPPGADDALGSINDLAPGESSGLTTTSVPATSTPTAPADGGTGTP
jgi:hypothetical protein